MSKEKAKLKKRILSDKNKEKYFEGDIDEDLDPIRAEVIIELMKELYGKEYIRKENPNKIDFSEYEGLTLEKLLE